MLQDNENMNFENEPSPDNFVGETDSAQNTESTPENDGVTENERVQSPFFGATMPYTAEYIPYGYTRETYAEKKEIRQIALGMGFALLVATSITYLWQYVYMFIMSLLGFSANDAIGVLRDSASLEVIQIILSMTSFLLPYTILAKFNKKRLSDLIPFSKPKKDLIFPLFLIGIGFCAFANVAISQASYILEKLGFEYNLSSYDPPSGFFGVILTIISTAIIPAFVEEYAFRGVVFGLFKKYGQAFALIMSSVLFGIMHGNFRQIPFAFLVGLVLGIIRIKTDSIWLCFLIHGWNNLISVIISLFEGRFSSDQINIFYTAYLLLAMLVAVVGVLLISKKGNDIYTFEKSECKSSGKQLAKWFFSCWIIIVYVAIELIESMSFFFK